MKIKQLIKRLQGIEKKYGDIPVILSSDEEGNSYSSIDSEWSFGSITDEENNPDKVIGVCIYPFENFWDDYIKAVKDGIKGGLV